VAHYLEPGKSARGKISLSREQEQAAVLDLCSRDGSAREVAEKYGVSRNALYQWKCGLLGKEYSVSKPKRPRLGPGDETATLLARVESLKEQVETLEKQIYRLGLERDVLEVTAEVLKETRAPI
jgi:transposase-like protein